MSYNLVQADTIKLTYYTHHTHITTHTHMTRKSDLQLIQLEVGKPQDGQLNLDVE
jgi:hypothetical protein